MFKVGDRVVAKMPTSRRSSCGVCWVPGMDKYDGAVIEIKYVGDGFVLSQNCVFINEWLSIPSEFKGNTK